MISVETSAEQRTKMPEWWEDLPCPFHPSWALDDISERDLRHLKQNVDADDDKSMIVETAVYRAFLEFPRKRLFLNQPMDDPIKADQYLLSARKHVSAKFEGNRDAEIGYGIVINTFQMYIGKDETTESILRDLVKRKVGYPHHLCYVNVVRAYILSRLGPPYYDCALSLFESALKYFPENCEWLFGKALLIGREARILGYSLGRRNQVVLDLLCKEKGCLEHLLCLKPAHYPARALYGQVLNTLGEGEAQAQISLALQEDPLSHSVAMVAARFYRRKNYFQKAHTILQTLLKTCNMAEIHFQLGIIKTDEARHISVNNRLKIQQRIFYQNERRKLWEQALKHFDDCLKLNSSHYPCLSRRAEVNALLGNTKEARYMFQHLLSRFCEESLLRSEIMCIDSALEPWLLKKSLFSPQEIIKYSHRYITLVTELYANLTRGFDSSAGNVERHLQTLKEISINESHETYVRQLATLRVADASRRLKMFENAVTIYENLLQTNEAATHESEIIWGLAKCYLSQGLEDKAIAMADRLTGVNQATQQLNPNELYADAYLCKAKSKLGNDKLFRTEDPSLYKSVEGLLKQAIKMGSLEAGYVFLNLKATIKKYFFSLKFEIPEILGHIKLLCGQTYKGTIVHTHFNMTFDGGSKDGHNQTTAKYLVMNKINKTLKYEYSNDVGTRLLALCQKLEKLREKRLDFEIHLIESEGQKWDESCNENFKDIVSTLRNLLDHSISFYMKAVLKYVKGKSMFPVKFDKIAGEVDKHAAKEQLDKWIDETFQKCTHKLPDDVFETLLEVQPMYDSKNNWLIALHELNNELKHDTDSNAKETFEYRLQKPGLTLTWKSEDIVRESCEEVEKIVLFFLSKDEAPGGCENIHNIELDDNLFLEDLFS